MSSCALAINGADALAGFAFASFENLEALLHPLPTDARKMLTHVFEK
jgi:hypothetical protein